MRSDDKNLVLSKRMEKSGLQQDYLSLELDVIICSQHQTAKFGFCGYGRGCLLGISDTVSRGKSGNRPHFCMSLLNSVLKYPYS